ncbi:pyridoxamine 5'-phosphate oxidase [Flavobacterium sp.]|uniref:pyridoxamine 5'-phosphate oxidase n=1 Tax=Flavobacterium sp. TaxID=239 RepID=UPI0025F745CA|nr:pyridoxamine 5'-phosphate oxidase [Flavobacterium sp.]
MEDLSNYRKSYEKSQLLEDTIPEDPINLFHKWFHETQEFGGVDEVNAMTVATIGMDGFPKSRVVLLKKYDEEGFIFYTNYNSEKGKAIVYNPHICLSFFWHNMERQVIIKGIAEKTSETISDNYFNTRPEGSKLGAIVSAQSEVIPSRDYLDNKLNELESTYEGQAILRPKNWGGFLVKPIEVEFWQGRPNRLHDRIRYKLQDDFNWKIDRLSP